MEIENDYLQSSFSILEEQPMDMLLGLDMLKRHQVTFSSFILFSVTVTRHKIEFKYDENMSLLRIANSVFEVSFIGCVLLLVYFANIPFGCSCCLFVFCCFSVYYRFERERVDNGLNWQEDEISGRERSS